MTPRRLQFAAVMYFSSVVCLVLFALAANANLLVKKTFDPDVLVAGQDVTVNFVLYNVGSSPIFDVELRDSNWPEGWILKSGVISLKFDRIGAGESVSHSFVVTLTKSVPFGLIPPATVTYFEEQLSGQQFTVLSTAFHDRVYRSTYYSRIHYSTPQDWAIILFFAATSTLPSFLTWFYYHSNYENGLRRKGTSPEN